MPELLQITICPGSAFATRCGPVEHEGPRLITVQPMGLFQVCHNAWSL